MAKNSKLPFVLLNLAMTADGKIATANRAPFSFSSPRDREHMLELRATVDAVLNGARTADLNDISMGPGPAKYRRQRLRRGLAEYNLRVIVSGAGTVDPRAPVFQRPCGPIIILTTTRAAALASPPGKGVGVRFPRSTSRIAPMNLPDADRAGSPLPSEGRGIGGEGSSCSGFMGRGITSADSSPLAALRAVAAEVKAFGDQELDFKRAFRWLRHKHHVKRLLCEGGGQIDDALFRAGLVDELHLTICPKICGGQHAPTICDGQGFPTLAKSFPLELRSARRIADELFLIYRRPKKHPRSPIRRQNPAKNKAVES